MSFTRLGRIFFQFKIFFKAFWNLRRKFLNPIAINLLLFRIISKFTNRNSCTIVEYRNCNKISRFSNSQIATKSHDSQMRKLQQTCTVHSLQFINCNKFAKFLNSQFAKNYTILKFTICKLKLHNSQIHNLPPKWEWNFKILK